MNHFVLWITTSNYINFVCWAFAKTQIRVLTSLAIMKLTTSHLPACSAANNHTGEHRRPRLSVLAALMRDAVYPLYSFCIPVAFGENLLWPLGTWASPERRAHLTEPRKAQSTIKHRNTLAMSVQGLVYPRRFGLKFGGERNVDDDEIDNERHYGQTPAR